MEQQAVPPPEAIVLRSHRGGVRHPANAIQHKHVPVLSWGQRKAQGPHAVSVRSLERVGVWVPAVEGPDHTDPFGLGRLQAKLSGPYALGFRCDRTTHQQGNSEEDTKCGSPGLDHAPSRRIHADTPRTQLPGSYRGEGTSVTEHYRVVPSTDSLRHHHVRIAPSRCEAESKRGRLAFALASRSHSNVARSREAALPDLERERFVVDQEDRGGSVSSGRTGSGKSSRTFAPFCGSRSTAVS